MGAARLGMSEPTDLVNLKCTVQKIYNEMFIISPNAVGSEQESIKLGNPSYRKLLLICIPLLPQSLSQIMKIAS